MKICPALPELFHADGQTHIHDETKQSLFAILQTRLKTYIKKFHLFLLEVTFMCITELLSDVDVEVVSGQVPV